ncbi:hypothetical protein J6590_069198 [Homalodisca vitripennis]|nr:hypothetical protein J6590_069198 [Homalodisca vitripennis]
MKPRRAHTPLARRRLKTTPRAVPTLAWHCNYLNIGTPTAWSDKLCYTCLNILSPTLLRCQLGGSAAVLCLLLRAEAYYYCV